MSKDICLFDANFLDSDLKIMEHKVYRFSSVNGAHTTYLDDDFSNRQVIYKLSCFAKELLEGKFDVGISLREYRDDNGFDNFTHVVALTHKAKLLISYIEDARSIKTKLRLNPYLDLFVQSFGGMDLGLDMITREGYVIYGTACKLIWLEKLIENFMLLGRSDAFKVRVNEYLTAWEDRLGSVYGAIMRVFAQHPKLHLLRFDLYGNCDNPNRDVDQRVNHVFGVLAKGGKFRELGVVNWIAKTEHSAAKGYHCHLVVFVKPNSEGKYSHRTNLELARSVITTWDCLDLTAEVVDTRYPTAKEQSLPSAFYCNDSPKLMRSDPSGAVDSATDMGKRDIAKLIEYFVRPDLYSFLASDKYGNNKQYSYFDLDQEEEDYCNECDDPFEDHLKSLDKQYDENSKD